MSKLKKIMGTGAVMTVLFATLITVINKPTPALSKSVQITRASTPFGKSAWQQYFDREGVSRSWGRAPDRAGAVNVLPSVGVCCRLDDSSKINLEFYYVWYIRNLRRF